MSAGDASRFTDAKDELGVRSGKLVPVARAVSSNGAYWRCACDCGGEAVVAGFALRAARKAGRELSCAACRPRRPGTVQRRPA